MSGVCVIVAYRPKPGKEEELLAIVRSRVPTLRKEGLVTDRVPVLMRAKNGTLIEVSEWKSREAIDAAHKNPTGTSHYGTNSSRCAYSYRWRHCRRVASCLPDSSRWNRDRASLHRRWR